MNVALCSVKRASYTRFIGSVYLRVDRITGAFFGVYFWPSYASGGLNQEDSVCVSCARNQTFPVEGCGSCMLPDSFEVLTPCTRMERGLPEISQRGSDRVSCVVGESGLLNGNV
jgi:hypothetical protein